MLGTTGVQTSRILEDFRESAFTSGRPPDLAGDLGCLMNTHNANKKIKANCKLKKSGKPMAYLGILVAPLKSVNA